MATGGGAADDEFRGVEPEFGGVRLQPADGGAGVGDAGSGIGGETFFHAVVSGDTDEAELGSVFGPASGLGGNAVGEAAAEEMDQRGAPILGGPTGGFEDEEPHGRRGAGAVEIGFSAGQTRGRDRWLGGERGAFVWEFFVRAERGAGEGEGGEKFFYAGDAHG